MLNLFYPYEYAQSVFDLDYCKMYQNGVKGIIFDIDNTLVPRGKESTPEIDELFRQLHNIGFKTILLSNNGVSRIRKFTENIDTPFISAAGKPYPKNYYKAIKTLQLSRDEIVFVGDRIFTDILGANLSRVPNILVKDAGNYEESGKVARGVLENKIIKKYEISGLSHRLGDIIKSAAP